MKKLGHQIYIGNNYDRYLEVFKEQTESFVNIQNVDLTIWQEAAIRELIKNNYDQDIMDSFDLIRPYAFKVDFARLLVLNVHGGWYSDFGITFLKKIDDTNADLILFYDHPAKALYGKMGIQNSIIYAKPNNHFIQHSIQVLKETILSKEYGENFLDVTGPIRLYRAIANGDIKLSDNEFIYDCGKIMASLSDPSKEFSTVEGLQRFFADDSGDTVSAYYANETRVALYKNYIKSAHLKDEDSVAANYVDSWNKKLLYNE